MKIEEEIIQEFPEIPNMQSRLPIDPKSPPSPIGAEMKPSQTLNEKRRTEQICADQRYGKKRCKEQQRETYLVGNSHRQLQPSASASE